MIGLLSPNIATCNRWRDLTKVPPSLSPWLTDTEMLAGQRFNSLICLQGWQDRPSNAIILRAAQTRLRAGPNEPDNEGSTPINILPDRILVRRGAEEPQWQEVTPPQRPEEGHGEANTWDGLTGAPDEGIRSRPNSVVTSIVIRSGMITRAVYERMTPDEVARFVSFIHERDNRAAQQFADSITSQYAGGNASIEIAHRVTMIRTIADHAGGAGDLEHISTRTLENLYRMAQEYDLLVRTAGHTEELGAIRARFQEMLEAGRREANTIRMARTIGGTPTQPPPQLTTDPPLSEEIWDPRNEPTPEGPPPTPAPRPRSGPPTGVSPTRTPGQALPFADVFRPRHRSAEEHRAERLAERLSEQRAEERALRRAMRFDDDDDA